MSKPPLSQWVEPVVRDVAPQHQVAQSAAQPRGLQARGPRQVGREARTSAGQNVEDLPLVRRPLALVRMAAPAAIKIARNQCDRGLVPAIAGRAPEPAAAPPASHRARPLDSP